MKIKEILQRIVEKRKINKTKEILNGDIYSNIVYTNNHLDLIYHASKLCYDKDDEDDNATQNQKEKYIAKRIESSHESILEHSNIVSYIEFNVSLLPELAEVLTHCLYLKTKVVIAENTVFLLIGGSIRGYKHIIRNIVNQDNKIAHNILSLIGTLNRCYFGDFFDAGLLTEHHFPDVRIANNPTILENTDIKNVDDLQYIMDITSNKFSINDLLDICTITMKFSNISRIISQQLTRHRNGITQLSQRYVGAAKFKFNSPARFKPLKYDKDKLFKINSRDTNGHTTQSQYNLQDLGEYLLALYPQLVEQGLIKEDSRAYLPNNATTELYVTFTFRNLINFLNLRTDSHAQVEIREYANDIERFFINAMKNTLDSDIYKYLNPIYSQYILEDNIDEILEETSETIDK